MKITSKCTDPDQRETAASLDMLIKEIKAIKDAVENADLRSVDLSTALAIAENLKLKILKEHGQTTDWLTIMSCVLWLVEVVQKLHSFLSCKISGKRGYCEYWRSNKTCTHHRWHLSKRAG